VLNKFFQNKKKEKNLLVTISQSKISQLSLQSPSIMKLSKRLFFLEKYRGKVLGGFVRIFDPAHSRFRCRSALILDWPKFQTLVDTSKTKKRPIQDKKSLHFHRSKIFLL